MNNIISEQYPPNQTNFPSFYHSMPPPSYPISQNFDYFQGMLPYMNYPSSDNYNEQYQIFNPYFDQKNSEINLKNETQNESPMKSTTIEDSKDKILLNKKEEEKNYINLLVNSVNKLFDKGEITMEYLNSEIKPKFDPHKFSLTLNNLTEDTENIFCKKCDNKTCAYLADNPHKLFQAKFFYSSSYKPKTLWLCEKCYKAYTLENYCYYCHIIYREYEHGTQYYDRKQWIQCDFCYKWHHMQCEEKKGKYENIEELSMNNNFKYMCPFCRKEHESIMRQKHKNEKMKKILGYKNNNNNNNNNFLNIKRKEKKLPLNEVININEFNKISNKNK